MRDEAKMEVYCIMAKVSTQPTSVHQTTTNKVRYDRLPFRAMIKRCTVGIYLPFPHCFAGAVSAVQKKKCRVFEAAKKIIERKKPVVKYITLAVSYFTISQTPLALCIE